MRSFWVISIVPSYYYYYIYLKYITSLTHT